MCLSLKGEMRHSLTLVTMKAWDLLCSQEWYQICAPPCSASQYRCVPPRQGILFFSDSAWDLQPHVLTNAGQALYRYATVSSI